MASLYKLTLGLTLSLNTLSNASYKCKIIKIVLHLEITIYNLGFSKWVEKKNGCLDLATVLTTA
jgi:hypothetical protein